MRASFLYLQCQSLGRSAAETPEQTEVDDVLADSGRDETTEDNRCNGVQNLFLVLLTV